MLHMQSIKHENIVPLLLHNIHRSAHRAGCRVLSSGNVIRYQEEPCQNTLQP